MTINDKKHTLIFNHKMKVFHNLIETIRRISGRAVTLC